MYDQVWVEPDTKEFIDCTKCIRCGKKAIGNTGVCKQYDTGVGRPKARRVIITCKMCGVECLRAFTAKYCLDCMRKRARESSVKRA